MQVTKFCCKQHTEKLKSETTRTEPQRAGDAQEAFPKSLKNFGDVTSYGQCGTPSSHKLDVNGYLEVGRVHAQQLPSDILVSSVLLTYIESLKSIGKSCFAVFG